MIAAALLAALLAGVPQAAKMHGIVTDAKSTTPIADAQVAIVELSRTIRTTADGRFEFRELKPGSYTVTISTIGYIFVRRHVEVTAGTDVSLAVPLAEGTGTYAETVNVSAETTTPPSLGGATQIDLGSAGLSDLRGVAADDPMRAMQALPGVATGDDFQAEFSVRGSAFRHVGVVIDGTATPMLLHAVRGADDTGSIAMINTDILSHGTLLAGTHPQRHGDWLGATLEFDVREGTRDRLALRAAVSGTSASTVVEGPLGPGKRGSWLFSARKSYIDWLIRKVEPGIDSTLGFVDGTAKLVYDVTRRNQFQLLALGGQAVYKELQASAANGLLRAQSNTGLVSAMWRTTGKRWVLSERVSFVGSDFHNRGVFVQELARGYNQALIARVDFSTTLGGGWSIDAGGRRERYRMNQILRDFVTFAGGTQIRVRSQREVTAATTQLGGWAQVGKRTAAYGFSAGLRVAGRTLATGAGVSPWVLAERRVGTLTFRASAGGSTQFFDPALVLANDAIIRPEHARSFDLGAAHQLTRTIQWQVTVFSRQESQVLRTVGENRVDPVRHVRIVESVFPLFSGSIDGSARGVDVVLQRRAPSGLTGWIGYTWAHTEHRDTTTGETFDADFDQRHTLNVFALQRLSYRLTFSAKLRVGSNFPLVGYFEKRPDGIWLAEDRNRVRLPVYARLDLRANRTFTFHRSRLTLFVEVMNALGRRNVGQSDGAIRPSLEAVGYGERLIPFVPSAGFLIEF